MEYRTAISFGLAGVALSACTPAEKPVSAGESAGQVQLCKAEPVQSFLGQTASQETGAEMIAASGARTLRWAPPRSAMTMDFRPDRLTVSYDDALTIIRVSCG
ncbi:MAG: I78 family peptidase inhibitor [Sphingobium sp.]